MQKLIPTLDKVVVTALFVFVAFCMFSISITQIAGGIGGFAWLWRTKLTDSWKDQKWPLLVPFGLYILACLIAVANAYDPLYSAQEIKKLLEILIFFWVINCVQEKKIRDLLVLILFASATVAGLNGLYQILTSMDNFVRIEGTMSVYMTYAGLLMIVGLMALARLLYRRPQEPWLLVLLIIIMTCLVFTLTRQAWLGFFVGSMFFLFMWKKNFFVIIFLTILVTVIFFKDEMKDEMHTLLMSEEKKLVSTDTMYGFRKALIVRFIEMARGKDQTFIMRKALWQGGWEIFKDYPVTGCGFKCVDLVSDQYPDPTGLIKRLRGMHNNFLQLAVDTGIFGLSAWLGIWFCFFRLLRQRTLALEGESADQWVIFGGAATVIGFLGGGFFESNFYDSEVIMLVYFIMALSLTEFKNHFQKRVTN